MFRRRVDLDLGSRRALAEAAGVGKRTVDSIETGERVSETSMYKIERALGWAPGSAGVVLDGGEPTLLEQLTEPEPAEPTNEELTEMANSLARQVEELQEMLRRRSESA